MAFSNWPSLERQAARLHSRTELCGSSSSPWLYTTQAWENFSALKRRLPFDRAEETALAFLTAVMISLLLGSSFAAS